MEATIEQVVVPQELSQIETWSKNESQAGVDAEVDAEVDVEADVEVDSEYQQQCPYEHHEDDD